VLNCNSQLKHGEFHKDSAPRNQWPVRPWSRQAARILQPSFDFLEHMSSVWSGAVASLWSTSVILEDNTRLHISTCWSANLLMRGGSATSFPSYFLRPRKGAYIAALESADKVFLCLLYFIQLLILFHRMLLVTAMATESISMAMQYSQWQWQQPNAFDPNNNNLFLKK